MKNFDDSLRQGVVVYTEEKLQSPLYREDEFEFSPEFEKKMDKMLKSEHNLYHKLTLTRARRAVLIAAIIAAMLAASLSVEAVRNTIANFFVQIFSDHDTISANIEEGKYPTALEKKYELGYIPAGFKISDHTVLSNDASYTYTGNDSFLFFRQCTKDSFVIESDNEFTDKSSETINGQEFFISDRGNDQYDVYWDNGEYVFWISTILPKNEVIKVCTSVKEVETN